MKSKRKYPLLKGFVNKEGKLIRVWCPFCKRFHIHGWSEGESMTHRVSHCIDPSIGKRDSVNSPLEDTGYLIAKFSNKDLRK